MKNSVYFFIAFLLLMACDPCDDCNEPVTFEPTISLKFINQDSITSIDNALLAYDSLDSSYISINSLLVVFRDSLQELEDSITKGLTEYETARQNMLDSIDNRQIDSLFLEALKIDSNVSVLSTARSTISSGLLKVRQINLPETGEIIDNSDLDSATLWTIPLSYQKRFTQYELIIHEELFSIEVDYETYTEVDAERNVLIRAKDIQVIEHTFDSLISCENCVDGKASFTLYF